MVDGIKSEYRRTSEIRSQEIAVMGLHHYQASFSMLLTVQEGDLNKVIDFDLEKLLDNLVEAVIIYEKKEALGYYPALSYLFDKKAVPEKLGTLLDSACRLTRMIAVNLIQTQLQAAFSQTGIVSVDYPAYNLPRVKPKNPYVYKALKYHYRPHLLHIAMNLSQIHKRPVEDSYNKFAKHLVYRWLAECFDRIEILSIERDA